jgi:hypothetical protein
MRAVERNDGDEHCWHCETTAKRLDDELKGFLMYLNAVALALCSCIHLFYHNDYFAQ